MSSLPPPTAWTGWIAQAGAIRPQGGEEDGDMSGKRGYDVVFCSVAVSKE